MKTFLSVVVFLIAFVTVGSAQIFFTAKIDGSQENPPVTTNASGTGAFVLNAAGTELAYNITVNGLTMTAAHFHNGAAGTNAGVVRNLSFIDNTATGVWRSTDASQPLTDSLLSELLRGRLYVNVHTSANPGGEIRGQVLLSVPVGFSAKLDGSQENPAVTTNARGSGSVTLNTDGTVTYDVTVTGLTPTASHFHNAPVGTNAGVVKNFTLIDNTASGTWSSSDATQPLTNQLLRELVRGRLYMNVHTSANPGGEIRGQVLLNTGASFTAKLDGAQENPSVSTPARGTGSFVLNAAGTQLHYHVVFDRLTHTAAHFHNAAAGTNAGVVKDLSFTNNTASGVWSSSDANQPLTDALLSELLNGRLYVNVHTSANPGGEIRGQVLMTSGVGFMAMISGGQENPAITTSASGTGSVVLNTNGTIGYEVTVTRLTPTASHFHNAPAGTNAGVVKNITLVDNSSSGMWTSSDATQPLTDLLMRELIKGRLYMNVHTSANPGGEIRGQVSGSTGIATSVERTDHDVIPVEFMLDQNYPNPFNPATTITYRLARTGTVSLSVFNTLGQLVATLVDGLQEAGIHNITFEAGSLPSGIYLYRLTAGGATVQAKKMMLLK
ncbi:MAG: CHRD domain-containing protein [Ignavibacteriales bacterium]|nr:CHRD domain-containing protein [Ignavibacteriales bacterium]